jgi:hypothetical protein
MLSGEHHLHMHQHAKRKRKTSSLSELVIVGLTIAPTTLEELYWYLETRPKAAFAKGWSVGFGAFIYQSHAAVFENMEVVHEESPMRTILFLFVPATVFELLVDCSSTQRAPSIELASVSFPTVRTEQGDQVVTPDGDSLAAVCVKDRSFSPPVSLSSQ